MLKEGSNYIPWEIYTHSTRGYHETECTFCKERLLPNLVVTEVQL